MQLQDFYPIIVTEHLLACRNFYRRWFELDSVFQATWFKVFSGKGMCLEFQVADVTAEYTRFQGSGAPIALPLRDEPFGQRRFGLFDPAGVWIDVVEQIESAPGWWDRYLPVPGGD